MCSCPFRISQPDVKILVLVIGIKYPAHYIISFALNQNDWSIALNSTSSHVYMLMLLITFIQKAMVNKKFLLLMAPAS